MPKEKLGKVGRKERSSNTEGGRCTLGVVYTDRE